MVTIITKDGIDYTVEYDLSERNIDILQINPEPSMNIWFQIEATLKLSHESEEDYDVWDDHGFKNELDYYKYKQL